MEQLIVAVILIFLLIFGVLTLSGAFIEAQSTLEISWEDMNSRASAQANTGIAPVELRILDEGGSIEVTIRNSGGTKLADYDRWDVFAEYTADGSVFRSGRLTYQSAAPSVNEWTVAGLFLDRENDIAESYDPDILNPGEELTLELTISPAVGVGEAAHVTLVTQNGATTTLIGTRNVPPSLTLNTGLKVAAGGGAVILSDMLLAQDPDNDPDEIVYTIVTPPATGTLTLDDQVIQTPITEFTQAQIDARQVVYTHIGNQPDSFAFTISDGIDTVGSLDPFMITLDETPVLDTINPTISLPALSTRNITSADLRTSDLDDPAENLIYTVTQLPSDGFLSLGATFTQQQINDGALSYTHTGTDADLFKFVVSDGYDVIGAYIFLITLE